MSPSCHSLGPFMAAETRNPLVSSLSDNANVKTIPDICILHPRSCIRGVTSPHFGRNRREFHVRTRVRADLSMLPRVFFPPASLPALLDSGRPSDDGEANINSRTSALGVFSFKKTLTSCTAATVKHVEHFLSQSCFHLPQDSGPIWRRPR